MHDLWTWTMLWGLPEGVGVLGGGKQGGGVGTNIIPETKYNLNFKNKLKIKVKIMTNS